MISDAAIQEVKEVEEQLVSEKEQEEWNEFFMFLENMFSDSPHCCDPWCIDFFNKMITKMKKEVKSG